MLIRKMIGTAKALKALESSNERIGSSTPWDLILLHVRHSHQNKLCLFGADPFTDRILQLANKLDWKLGKSWFKPVRRHLYDTRGSKK